MTVTIETWSVENNGNWRAGSSGFPFEAGNGVVRYIDMGGGKIGIIEVDVANKTVRFRDYGAPPGYQSHTPGRITPVALLDDRVYFLIPVRDQNGNARLALMYYDVANDEFGSVRDVQVASNASNFHLHPLWDYCKIYGGAGDSPSNFHMTSEWGVRVFNSVPCGSGYFGLPLAFDGRCALIGCHYWIPGQYSRLAILDTQGDAVQQIDQYDSGCGSFAIKSELPDGRLLLTGCWCTGATGSPSRYYFARLENCTLNILGVVDTGAVVPRTTCNQNNRLPVVYRVERDGSLEVGVICYWNTSADQGFYRISIDANYNVTLVEGAKDSLTASWRAAGFTDYNPFRHLLKSGNTYYAVIPAFSDQVKVAVLSDIDPNINYVDVEVAQKVPTILKLYVKVL